MKKLIAFLRFLLPISIGLSIFTKQYWVCNFRLLNVKQKNGLFHRRR